MFGTTTPKHVAKKHTGVAEQLIDTTLAPRRLNSWITYGAPKKCPQNWTNARVPATHCLG